MAALFTKFDPRAFLDDERNASAATAGGEPSLATLASLAGRKTHCEKSERDTVTDVPDTNARAEDAAAKAAKAEQSSRANFSNFSDFSGAEGEAWRRISVGRLAPWDSGRSGPIAFSINLDLIGLDSGEIQLRAPQI